MAQRVLGKIQALMAVVGVMGAAAYAAAPAQAFFHHADQHQIVTRNGDWQPPAFTIRVHHDDQLINVTELIDDVSSNFLLSLADSEYQTPYSSLTSVPLSFSYRVQSTEILPGFDEPALLVSVNDQVIFQDWLTAWPQTSGQIDSGWQDEVVILPPGIEQQIKFQVINFDQDYPTQVEITSLTTKNLLLSSLDSIEITTEPGAKVYMGFINSADQPQTIEGEGSLTVLAQDLPSAIEQIQVWAVDDHGNTSPPANLALQIDQDAPFAPNNLSLVHQDQLETIISWVTPTDLTTRVDHYLWRIYDSAEDLITTFAQPYHLPYQLTIAKPAGEKDWLVFPSLPTNADQIELIAVDVVGNLSSRTILSLQTTQY